MTMGAEFSLVSVVLFIASGVLVFLLLFMFAKRQIMRFTWNSAKKPHVSIGSDVSKVLSDQIHLCLERTKNIFYDPTLLSEEVQNIAQSSENHYYYRMKALDAFSNAVTTLQWSDSSVPKREARQTIQLYLYCLCPSAAGSKDAAFIEKFVLMYNHARHSPLIFGEAEFTRYMEILDKVIRLIKMDQRRRSKTPKAVDLEVLITDGSSSSGTLTQATKSESIPLQPMSRFRQGVLQSSHLSTTSDFSSGTERSNTNSDHGSEERLIFTEDKRV